MPDFFQGFFTTPLPDAEDKFFVGDRVKMIADTDVIPQGAQGTVVGIERGGEFAAQGRPIVVEFYVLPYRLKVPGHEAEGFIETAQVYVAPGHIDLTEKRAIN